VEKPNTMAAGDDFTPKLSDLLHNGRSIAEYWTEWFNESNPWREALMDGDHTVEVRVLLFLAMFLILHAVMLKLRPIVGEPLASRPTLIANQIHCSTTSFLATYLLYNHWRDGVMDDFLVWQQFGIPLSLAYFMADILWYCIPERDGLILFHHITMLLCHYPVSSHSGALLCGAGDALWTVRLSMMGYLCELSNPLMNWRWWLLQTLEKDRIDFALVNIVLVFSFIGRTFLLGWLLVGVLIPKAALFVEAKQVFVYTLCILGHAVILLLSLYWLKVLCGGGVKNLLKFKKKKSAKGKFTFGTDMGREKTPEKGKKA